MKKLKDILYDKNDILLALVIVAVAAFVIIGRIDAILAYPASLITESGTAIDEQDEPVVYTGDEQNDSNNSSEGAITGEVPEDQHTDENVKIHIEFGSTGEKIAEILMEKGLIESRQEFYNAVTAAGADTKLQAGDFTIPADATPAEVIAIITR